MIGGEIGEHLLRRLVRFEFLGDLGELRLIRAQVGHVDLDELVERNVDHLVVLQLLRVGVGAELEVAVRLRQQVFLQPRRVFAQRLDHGGVGIGELLLRRGVVDVGEGGRHVVPEEFDQAGHLFERDLGEDFRRVFQIRARGGERRRHLLLARDEQAQALGRRRELALHDDEGAVGDAARIHVRVFLPRPDRFEREQGAADVVEHEVAVAARHFAEHQRIDRGEPRFVFLQLGDLPVDLRARIVFELVVVLVDAGLRCQGRIVREVIVVEKFVGHRGEGHVGRHGRGERVCAGNERCGEQDANQQLVRQNGHDAESSYWMQAVDADAALAAQRSHFFSAPSATRNFLPWRADMRAARRSGSSFSAPLIVRLRRPGI